MINLTSKTGASASLPGAVLINPWDIERTAKSIARALTMPATEKKKRYISNLDVVEGNTAIIWANNFIEDLVKASTNHGKIVGITPLLEYDQVSQKYLKASHRLIVLDFDGTLVDLQKSPLLVPVTLELKRVISDLAKNPKNLIYIVCGRTRKDLDDLFSPYPPPSATCGGIPYRSGSISLPRDSSIFPNMSMGPLSQTMSPLLQMPNSAVAPPRYFPGLLKVGICAEYGAFTRPPPSLYPQGENKMKNDVEQPGNDGSEWISEELDTAWMKEVEPLLVSVVRRTPGAYLEVKECGMCFHYRNCEPEYGKWKANELKLHLEKTLANAPVEIYSGKKATLICILTEFLLLAYRCWVKLYNYRLLNWCAPT